MAEGIDVLGASDLSDFGQVAALRHYDDAIVLAVIVVVLEKGTDVVDVDFLFRNEDDMSTGGDA